MAEPVSIADVERQLRIDDLSYEQTEVELFITAVRKRAETITKRALVETTEFLVLDTFPIILELRKPPLNEVTSIKYIDLEGVEQTLDPLAYRVIKDKSEPAMLSYIIPAYGTNWPTPRQDKAVITVEYTCGYTPVTCPEPIKQWILINVANLYENRESVVTSKNSLLDLNKTLADPLLDGYRIARL